MLLNLTSIIMKKTLQNCFIAFLLLTTSSTIGLAQITGVVYDATADEPLIGASILIKGTATGTTSDIDGKYTLNTSVGDVIIVSYLGYDSKEINVGEKSNLDVRLTQGLVLDQVVVTGYSVDTRRNTAGSVSTLDAVAVQAVPSGNVEQQLQGRVPGVTVVSNGQPGTTSQVRVRGYGSLSANEPLYVVDGVPTNNIEFLAPDDIENITVLKDATSASIYGARAASGVIVYTTKKAKKNQPLKVFYNGLIGITTPGEGTPIMNPQDQAEWTWKSFRNEAIQAGIADTSGIVDTLQYSHDQFGTVFITDLGEFVDEVIDEEGNIIKSDISPVLPDYLLDVDQRSGIRLPQDSLNLDRQENMYNIDPNLGDFMQLIKANKEGTDWYDAITRNALMHRHNVGFRGSTEKAKYYVGLNMQQQEGILLHQQFNRNAFRVNTEFDVLPWLRIGENLQVTHRSARILLGDNGGAGSSDDENIILSASRMASIIPVYDEYGGWAGTTAPGFNNPANPVAVLDGAKNDRGFSTGLFGNVFLELEPLDKLIFRTSLGGNYTSFNSKTYTRRQYENAENNTSFGFGENAGWSRNWVITNTLNYKFNVGNFADFDVLLGQEALNIGSFRTLSASGIDPFSQNVDFVTLNTVNNALANGYHTNGSNYASYFGRLNFDIFNKYIISAVVRRDGSSRFGSENRYGTFPAISAAWRLSDEAFLNNVSFIEDLKLRVGYGIMGNSNPVDPNNQFNSNGTNLDLSSYDISGSNSSAAQGFFRDRIGNPFAKWEQAITSNIGLDALFFNGRLDVGVELWQKNTEDLLFRLPITVMNGQNATAPFVNVGKMKNTGFDFSVVTKGKRNDFRYELNFTGGFLNNEIVELSENVQNLPGRSAEYRGITPILNQVGHPISSFYGLQVEGLWASQEEVVAANEAVRNTAIAANPELTQEEIDAIVFQDGAAPGRFKFTDLNGMDENGELTGVPDGKIDIADRTVIGNPVPDFTGGLIIDLDYKNFGIEMYTFASIGNEIYNVSKRFTDFALFKGAALSENIKDSWTFEDPTGEIPIYDNSSNFSNLGQSNSYYVEDGSYFRLQNITLSYNLPSSFIQKANMSKVRLFASANNLLTISGYSGLDPSVGGAADTNFGVDLGNYPITKSFQFGVNVEF